MGRDPGITSTYGKTQDCRILSIPAPMMQHSLRTTFQQKLHHAGISSSICFTNQFTRPCMMQVPNGSHLRTYFSIKIITTPQYSKTPLCPDHPQVQDKFGIEDDNDTEKSPQTKAWRSVRKYPPALKATTCTNRPTGSQGKSVYWFPHDAGLY